MRFDQLIDLSWCGSFVLVSLDLTTIIIESFFDKDDGTEMVQVTPLRRTLASSP